MAASDHLITLAFDVYIDSFEEVFEPRLNHKKNWQGKDFK